MRSVWSHISGRVVFAGLLFQVAIGPPAWPQQPDTRDYDSEEDLWEALREGEFSYDDYLDLLDDSRLGEDSTSVPASDWEALPGSKAGYLAAPDTAIELAYPHEDRPSHSTVRRRWWWRSGYTGDLTQSSPGEGYSLLRVRVPNVTGVLDWRHDGTHGNWQRRLVTWQVHGIAVRAGNVEPRFGRGLIVGRRSRVIGATTLNQTAGDWWQPARSRFNGLWITAGESKAFTADVVVSDIRSTRLLERMATAQLTAGISTLRVGLTALVGNIRNRDSSGTCAERTVGGHVRIGRSKHQLLGEIAVARGGDIAKAAEVLWRFEGGRFHGRAWSYASGFHNPWGGGPGHIDTRTVVLQGMGENFASRTAGERGVSLAYRLEPDSPLLRGHTTVDWEWLAHRESPNDPVQHAWALRASWNQGHYNVRPFARGTLDSNGTSRFGAGSSAEIGTAERRLMTRVELGRHNANNTQYIRAGLSARWKFNNALDLEPAVRWVDPDLNRPADGYWYLYLTEQIRPVSELRLEAALVWQRYEIRGKSGNVEIRVRMAGAI